MPVGSFVIGAAQWTPVANKQAGDAARMLPVGPLHAAEPQDATAVCSGEPVELDRERRSFTPWGPGTCDTCSAALAPRHARTPPDAHHRPERETPDGEPLGGDSP